MKPSNLSHVWCHPSSPQDSVPIRPTQHSRFFSKFVLAGRPIIL